MRRYLRDQALNHNPGTVSSLWLSVWPWSCTPPTKYRRRNFNRWQRGSNWHSSDPNPFHRLGTDHRCGMYGASGLDPHAAINKTYAREQSRHLHIRQMGHVPRETRSPRLGSLLLDTTVEAKRPPLRCPHHTEVGTHS